MSGTLEEQIYEVLIFSSMNLRHLLVSCFFWKLCKAFLQTGEGAGKKALWLVPVSYYGMMTILQLIPVILDGYWAYMIGIMAGFLVMVFVCRGDIWRKIFLCITFFSIRFHGMSVINSLHLLLFDVEARQMNRLTNGQFAQVWQWNMLHIFFYSIVDFLLEYLLFSFIIGFIIQKFPIKSRKLSGKETIFLLTPGILGAVAYYMVHWIYIRFETAAGQGITQTYPNFEIVILLMCLLSLASILVVIVLFADLEQKKEEEKKQAVLEHQIREMQLHIREIEQLYSGIRGMKHDVKNHIAAMEALMEQKKFEEAQRFLDSMNKAVESLDYVYKTGNPVTDVIINEKYNQAKEQNIRFETEFCFPSESDVDVFDISVILNNALENALEAARQTKEGSIRVSSVRRKQVWLLEVTNSFTGVLEFDEESGLPKTTKQDYFSHGIGLKNIRMMAVKYEGDIEIEIKDGRFLLTVMLNL